MKLRLLLIIEPTSGGGWRHVLDLVKGLDAKRFEIALVYGTSRASTDLFEQLASIGRKIRLFPCDQLKREINFLQDMTALSQIRTIIREYKPDIVHCHSSKAGIIGRLAAKRENISKVFYTPHAYSFMASDFSDSKKRLFILLERWFSRHATTATFTVSVGEKRAAISHDLDKPDKFHVIYNGIPDIELPGKIEMRKRLHLSQSNSIVGCTARLVAQKNPMLSIQIARKVIERNKDVHFAYIGDGPFLKQMSLFAAEAGIGTNVHFLGARKDAELVVSAFDVYLLTSTYEGLPYSLIEASRAGVPIVSTRVVGSDEVVLPGVNGELFDNDDINGGAELVTQLLRSPYSLEQVRSVYLNKFSGTKMVKSIERNYCE